MDRKARYVKIFSIFSLLLPKFQPVVSVSQIFLKKQRKKCFSDINPDTSNLEVLKIICQKINPYISKEIKIYNFLVFYSDLFIAQFSATRRKRRYFSPSLPERVPKNIHSLSDPKMCQKIIKMPKNKTRQKKTEHKIYKNGMK